MWIDRKFYEHFRLDWANVSGELTALKSRFAAQDTMVDWFRIRLTQLERERAQLIFNYTGVKIETPSFVPKVEEPVTETILNEATAFDDVGDEVAKRLGIEWAPDGTLSYSKKA